MSDFIPPRMEHVIIDEDIQMMRYLSEIAIADIQLTGGKRTERPGGLMAQYKRLVAEDRAAGGSGMGVAEMENLDNIERITNTLVSDHTWREPEIVEVEGVERTTWRDY